MSGQGQFADLVNATLSGFIGDAAIDVAVTRLLRRRVQVGDLDIPPTADPYHATPFSVVDSAAHRAFARKLVAEGAVLLHNAPGSALPLRRGGSYLVVGPSADDISVQAHTYHGTPWRYISVLQGLREVGGASSRWQYACGLSPCSRTDADATVVQSVVEAARADDVDGVVFVGGLQASLEEEGTDRVESIALPGSQLALIRALHAVGKPMAALTIHGGPVAEPLLASAPRLAWVWCSYFGQDGRGLADVLLGDAPFSGALPFTIPQRAADFGDIGNYSMRAPPYGRTYRYWRPTVAAAVEVEKEGQAGGGAAVAATAAPQLDEPAPDMLDMQGLPLYPFGFGLSLAPLTFEQLQLESSQGGLYCAAGEVCVTPRNDSVTATVVVSNGSPTRDGAAVVPLFGSFLRPGGAPSAVGALPVRQLLAFTKLAVPAGSSAKATLRFNVSSLAGALRQAWPGVLACWVGHGLALNPDVSAAPGSSPSHVGSAGEGAQPLFANLSLVLPMTQEPSDCRACS